MSKSRPKLSERIYKLLDVAMDRLEEVRDSQERALHVQRLAEAWHHAVEAEYLLEGEESPAVIGDSDDDALLATAQHLEEFADLMGRTVVRRGRLQPHGIADLNADFETTSPLQTILTVEGPEMLCSASPERLRTLAERLRNLAGAR